MLQNHTTKLLANAAIAPPGLKAQARPAVEAGKAVGCRLAGRLTGYHDRDLDAPPPRADLNQQQHAGPAGVPHIHHAIQVRVLFPTGESNRRHGLKKHGSQARRDRRATVRRPQGTGVATRVPRALCPNAPVAAGSELANAPETWVAL